nr:ABC transporter permease subunit [Mangrovitalea sediminis]
MFYWQLAFTLLICLFMIVPVVMSVTAGLTENYFVGLSSGLTTRWLVEVWNLYAQSIWLSIYLALSCLGVTLVLGIPAAYGLLKSQKRWASLVEELLLMPVAVPGLATALALLLAYGGFRGFRSSWLFILVGHVLFTLPFMIRPVLAVMQSINVVKLEEAASSLGARPVQRFLSVVLPNCTSGILAGALMVLTLSVGEFNITWMLHTPLTKTLPVGLADSYASMRLEVGSAYTLIFLMMILPFLIVVQWLGQVMTRKASARVS